MSGCHACFWESLHGMAPLAYRPSGAWHCKAKEEQQAEQLTSRTMKARMGDRSMVPPAQHAQQGVVSERSWLEADTRPPQSATILAECSPLEAPVAPRPVCELSQERWKPEQRAETRPRPTDTDTQTTQQTPAGLASPPLSTPPHAPLHPTHPEGG